MSQQPNQKASDEDIITLNNMGMSVTGIAEFFDMHPTSVSARLKRLNIPVVNPRRAFMDGLLRTLTSRELEWLSKKVTVANPINVLLRELITEAFNKETKNQ